MTVTSRDLPFLSRSFYRAPNEVAAAALYAHEEVPSTTGIDVSHVQTDTLWTPRLCPTDKLESSGEEGESHLTVKSNCRASVQVFNSAMENLAEVSGQKKVDQLQYQLKSWDACTDVEREKFVCKATEACRLVCNVTAPNDGEKLLQALQGEKVNGTTADPGLEALVAAYRRAPSHMLRTQILSIYANRFEVSELKALHLLFENVSDRQIKKPEYIVLLKAPISQ